MGTPSKVLFINHPESDYGGAMLYHGLCKLYGGENVYCVPRKPSYHGKAHKYSIPRIPEGNTGPYPWLPAQKDAWEGHENIPSHVPLNTVDDIYVRDAAAQMLRDGEFQLVVVESTRALAFTFYMQLKQDIKNAGIPVAVHEGEDFEQMRDAELNEMGPNLILKREFPKHWPDDMQAAGVRVIPFPFSFVVDEHLKGLRGEYDKPFDEREYDITFMCGNTHPSRAETAQVVNGLSTEYKTLIAVEPAPDGVPARNLYSWPDYMAQMCNSRVSVTQRGFGWDTVRYWEVPWCSVMLNNEPGIKLPFPFAHGSTGLSYSRPEDIPAILKEYLGNKKEELQEIYVNGVQHLMKYHTTTARVKYMLHELGVEPPKRDEQQVQEMLGKLRPEKKESKPAEQPSSNPNAGPIDSSWLGGQRRKR